MARAVERNKAAGKPVTYSNLTMPEETSDYVPKLQAVKNLLLNPGSLAQSMPPLPNRPYLGSVRTPFDLAMRDAVRLSGVPAVQFNLLNAGYTGATIPRGDRIVLPVEALGEFEARMRDHFARRPPPRVQRTQKERQ